MITLIFGPPGAGKTALMVKMAMEYMIGANARQDVRACSRMVEQLNAGGFYFTAPTDHLVYSDTAITMRRGKVRSHDVNGFDLGLYDPTHFTKIFPPFSRFFLDEASKYFNSRERSGVADSVSRFYELHRHNHFEITLAAQRPGLIDKNIRELAERVIRIDHLELEQSHGRIDRMIWHCQLFDKAESAVNFVDGCDVDFTEERIVYEGNVFRHYNSFYHQPAHYNAAYRRDFERALSENYALTVDDIQSYNNDHSYTSPIGYFKKVR